MTNFESIEEHYSIEGITGAIEKGLEASGRSIETVTIDDLSAVDEFHTGGRLASEHFFDHLGFTPKDHILDIGCGIGGAARYVANQFGSNVSGIDLTEVYIQTGRELNKWVELETKVNLEVGNALSLDFPEETFDGGYTMHALMNVEDKSKVFDEAHRVLKSGAKFGIYDVTKTKEGAFAFPVPWAAEQKNSFLASPGQYVEMLEVVGFEVEFIIDRRDFALKFFETVKEKMAALEGPPVLGIHILMGENGKRKLENFMENLIKGIVSPFEIGARKL